MSKIDQLYQKPIAFYRCFYSKWHCIQNIYFYKFMHTLGHENILLFELRDKKTLCTMRYAIKYILEKHSLLCYGDTNIDKQNHKLKSAGGSEAIS